MKVMGEFMTDMVKKKIRLFCEKGKMDVKNLKVTKSDKGYIASDKRMSMMFDKEGKPISLPLNKSYGSMGNKMGKWMSLVYITVIVGVILFVAIGTMINKFLH